MLCFPRLGMSSSQLTNSYFSEGLKPPTSIAIVKVSVASQGWATWSIHESQSLLPSFFCWTTRTDSTMTCWMAKAVDQDNQENDSWTVLNPFPPILTHPHKHKPWFSRIFTWFYIYYHRMELRIWLFNMNRAWISLVLLSTLRRCQAEAALDMFALLRRRSYAHQGCWTKVRCPKSSKG